MINRFINQLRINISDQLPLLERLLQLPVEQHVHCDDRQQPHYGESDHLRRHQVRQILRSCPQALGSIQALEKLGLLVLKPAQFALEVLGVGLVGQEFELHELEAGLDVGAEGHLVVADVADAEGVGGVGGGQFVDIEGLELSLGLLVVHRVPLAVDHVADLHLELARTGRGHIDRVLLLRFWVEGEVRSIS